MRNSIRETGGKKANGVSFGRDSNRDLDFYWKKLIKTDKNDNTSSSITIEDGPCKPSDSFLSHIFCFKWKR